jgi:hypothetical protein
MLLGLTFRELIDRHGQKPESKFLSYKGENCRNLSRGLLVRRRVHVADVLHIGKEANEIDRVQAGLVGSEEEVRLYPPRKARVGQRLDRAQARPRKPEIPFNPSPNRARYRKPPEGSG